MRGHTTEEIELEELKMGNYDDSWGQYYPTKRLPTRCTYCGKKAVMTKSIFMGGLCYGVCEEHRDCECMYSHSSEGVFKNASMQSFRIKRKNHKEKPIEG